MDSMEVERLYLLYKSGHNSEPDNSRPESERRLTGDILQIANATAPDLSEEDFGFIALQVETLSRMRDNRDPDAPSHAKLTNAKFQELVWELPQFMQDRAKAFRPKRDRQNRPVERSSNTSGQTSTSGLDSQPDASPIAQPPVPAPPIINPAEVRKALAQDSEDDSESPGEPAPGMVRVYHSGSVGDGSPMSKRWVTTDEKYNFRNNAPLHYLDLPANDKRLTPEYPDQGIKQGFHRNFELEPHEAVKLKPVRAKEQAKPSQQPETEADRKAWVQQQKQAILESIYGKKQEQSNTDSDQSSEAASSAVPQQSQGSSFIDKLQTILDGVGVADPTPVTDGVNMAISLGRAFLDPQNAGRHLVNAGVSAVSMVPLVGDLAKLSKFGARAATKEAGAAAKATAHGGHASAVAGVVNTVGQVAAAAGGGSGGAGAGFPGAPADGDDGGGSGNSAAGAAAGAGGFNFGNVAKWAGIGAVIYFGFKTAMQQGRDFISLFKPDSYTGNSFDSFGASADRTNKTVDAVMPLAKYSPFEQMRRATVEFAKKVVEWLKSIENEGDKMISANRRLGEYSGVVAVAFNQLDVDRIKRDISKAQTMGGDFKNLSAAQSRFEAAKQDLFQPFERLQVTVQTGLLNIGTGLMKIIDSMEVVTEFIDWWLGYQKSTDARNGLEDAIQKSEQPPKKRI